MSEYGWVIWVNETSLPVGRDGVVVFVVTSLVGPGRGILDVLLDPLTVGTLPEDPVPKRPWDGLRGPVDVDVSVLKDVGVWVTTIRRRSKDQGWSDSPLCPSSSSNTRSYLRMVWTDLAWTIPLPSFS